MAVASSDARYSQPSISPPLYSNRTYQSVTVSVSALTMITSRHTRTIHLSSKRQCLLHYVVTNREGHNSYSVPDADIISSGRIVTLFILLILPTLLILWCCYRNIINTFICCSTTGKGKILPLMLCSKSLPDSSGMLSTAGHVIVYQQ